ncbi:hypothetical protein [uncultured Legionella sp.]|uniref:hypothetical protein n=1 Tax=uncultured Legionella sp. TaxID=210934 RepID=UPI00260F195D|nr:hypothetical protein [uncultured Legionella sp.]
MDFQRKLIALCLFFFSTIIQAIPDTTPNMGMALVHGTRDHREDAYGGYWKVDFIEEMSRGLARPGNLFVVHCDFSQYMWHEDAANCVADQLLDFIKEKEISSMTVYTHSNGANIMRWILSNPTYDSRYITLKNKISQVIAVAPSSGGTPLADEVFGGGVFETSLAWLMGYLSDAIKQQRIGDMLLYNEELLFGSKGRPSLPVPFRVIVGSEVLASPFSSASYCNGYLLNSGLKITRLFLENCADGFINCTSQAAAGELWFYDRDKTDNNEPLSHNQSRHSCFGLDKILKSALSAKGVA